MFKIIPFGGNKMKKEKKKKGKKIKKEEKEGAT